MKWVRRLWLLLCLVYVGCAADGGPVGTGVSSTASSISGNVIDVQSNSNTSAAADSTTAPAVRVSIDEVAGAQTTTDNDGNFQLTGNFSGMLTLRFTVPQFQVTQPVDVPSGSAIVLQDIELAPDGVQEQAARQLEFIGRVADGAGAIDCADGTLLVDDPHHMNMQFMVRLTDQTSIVRGNGQSLDCGQIEPGDTVAVEGAIQLQTDRTISALTVTVGPPALPGGPRETRPVPFLGDVAALNCAGDFIVIDDTMQRSRLQISGKTSIERADGTSLQCSDLRLGDHMRGEGHINLAMPGTITAQRIVVAMGPPPGKPLRFFGFVTAVDCSAGVVQLGDLSSAVRVHLLPTTLIVRGKNDLPAQCADIKVGDRVTGTGNISTANPEVIDAVMLTFMRRGGPEGQPPPRSNAHGGQS